VQFFSSVRNIERASRPASRTVWVNSAVSRASVSRNREQGCTLAALTSPKRQALDAQRWSVNAVAELKVVGRHHRFEDIEQMARDRHLADRIGELAIFDPEAGSAAAVVAGDTVDA